MIRAVTFSRWTLFAALLLGVATVATAQPAKKEAPLPKGGKYKFNTPNVNLRTNPGQFGTQNGIVQKVLKGELPLADNPNFDSFFKLYYFPMMTLDDASLAGEKTSVPDLRVKFFRNYLNSSAAPSIHAHLANLALTEMQKIVQDDFHPAVRYNAMLLIGSLNESEVVRSGDIKDRAGPSPYGRAIQPMLDAYNAAETPDLVRVAALIGLVRHLEWDPWRSEDRKIPGEKRKEIINLLIGIIDAKDPPADRTNDGHQWMRRKAVEGLGYAMIGKVDPNIVKTLDKVMDDEKDRAEIRTAAAIAFGRANFTGVTNYNVQQAVARLANVTEGVLESEVHRLHEQRKKEETQVGVVGSTQGIGGGGGVPMMRQEMRGNPNQIEPEDPHYYRVEYSRRKVRAGLFGIEGALNGVDDRPSMNNPRTWAADRQASGEVRGLTLLAAAKPAAQAKADKDAVEKLKKEIDRLVKIIENDTVDQDRESYEEALKSAAAEVSQAIAVGAAAPAAKQPAGAAPEEPAVEPAKKPAVEELPE